MMPIEWNGHAITVDHVFPPIPTREMDYCAYLDGLSVAAASEWIDRLLRRKR
jgi:hypothetical protein